MARYIGRPLEPVAICCGNIAMRCSSGAGNKRPCRNSMTTKLAPSDLSRVKLQAQSTCIAEASTRHENACRCSMLCSSWICADLDGMSRRCSREHGSAHNKYWNQTWGLPFTRILLLLIPATGSASCQAFRKMFMTCRVRKVSGAAQRMHQSPSREGCCKPCWGASSHLVQVLAFTWGSISCGT